MLGHMDYIKEEIAKQKPGLPCADCCVSACVCFSQKSETRMTTSVLKEHPNTFELSLDFLPTFSPLTLTQRQRMTISVQNLAD